MLRLIISIKLLTERQKKLNRFEVKYANDKVGMNNSKS